ncbi:unnamed protein product [Umbelopsis ramanniana]
MKYLISSVAIESFYSWLFLLSVQADFLQQHWIEPHSPLSDNMLETLWTLTGLAAPSPEQKELPKMIVIKPLNDNKMKSVILKEDHAAENISTGNTEKISVQLVEEDNDQDSLFFDVEKEFSEIKIVEEDLPPLPLSPTEEEECSVTGGNIAEEENLIDSINTDSENHMEEVDTQFEKEPTTPTEWVVTPWDSVIQPCPPAALACCSHDGAVPHIGSDQIRTATLPHVNTSRPSLIRNSIMVPRTKDIDRYKVLYKIKYDSRKSRDSWLTLDGRLSIRNSKSGMPRVKQFWQGFKDSKSTGQLPLAYVQQRRSQAKGQYFFWGGFACPIIWVIGAWYLEKTASSADDMWRRRCSRAAMLATVMSVCCLIVFFVVHPSIFVPRMSFKPPTGTTVFGLD